MIIDMTGGMSLNFAVTAYPDEVSLLSDKPGLNTIGVVTGTEFPGWQFSQTEPESPADGLLWFKTGDHLYSDVPFSAVPGNQIMVYPLSAFQWQSGAWKEISVRSYQEKDGAAQWVEWIKQTVWLVKEGILAVAFETDDAGHMTITQGDESVTFQSSANGGYATIALDLTYYSKVVIEGTKFSTHTSNKFGVWASDVSPATNNAAAITSFGSTSGKTELNVSELSGVHNVGLMLLGGSAYNADVTNFYLTRS